MAKWRWGLVVLLPVPLILLYLFNPEQSWFYPQCLFYKLSGFYCPGCGSLRSIHSLLHGNFVKGFSYNPLLVSFIPLLAANSIIELLHKRGLVQASPPFQSRWVVILVGLVMVVFWVLRNFESYPFCLLAPGKI
jgi:Protein of unknown function (DUF2752)